jgi:hypothetical protein
VTTYASQGTILLWKDLEGLPDKRACFLFPADSLKKGNVARDGGACLPAHRRLKQEDLEF